MSGFYPAPVPLEFPGKSGDSFGDVYVCAWQRATTYDAGRGSVMAWLAVMARNRAVDRLRQRRELVSLDDERHEILAASLAGDALGPEQMIAQFQSGSTVRRALQSLTPQRRHLLGLAFFQGLSHQEIADAVGHRHTQEEECLVLEGEVFIGGYRLSQGDMHVARPGAAHAQIRAPKGALLMIRSATPPPNFRIA